MTRDENKIRDANRPVIVHCIAMLVQHSTHCDDDDAIQAAWEVWDYLGQPTDIRVTEETRRKAAKILRR